MPDQEFSRKLPSVGQRLQTEKFLDRVDNLHQVRQNLIKLGTKLNQGDVEAGLEFANGGVPMVGVLFDPTCEHCTFLTGFFALDGPVTCRHHV